ncbi:MAG: hypothetical protein ACLPHP_05205 [Candidatus Sulfotelmatobacter sp.]
MTHTDRLTLIVAALLQGKLYGGEQCYTDALAVATKILEDIEAAQ